MLFSHELKGANALNGNKEYIGADITKTRSQLLEPFIDARKNALNKGVFTTFMHMGALLSGSPSEIKERIISYYHTQEKKADPCTGMQMSVHAERKRVPTFGER